MKSRIYNFIVLLTLCSFGTINAQNYWKLTDESSLKTLKKDVVNPQNYAVFELNQNDLKNVLATAPLRGTNDQTEGVLVHFPIANGDLKAFRIFEAPVFDAKLSNKYPLIKSYVGQAVDDSSENIRFSLSQLGLKCMLFSRQNGYEFIEPFTEDLNNYIVYQRKDRGQNDSPFKCSVTAATNSIIQHDVAKTNADDSTLRTYKLAVSTTGEYADYFGGTVANALAAINATMTRVNGIYELEFSVTMELISDTDDVIYTDAATDPYSNAGSWNGEVQATLTSEIGEANYDIGHLFALAPDNGNAGCIGCVCVDNQKGSGWTSLSIPEGEVFDVDYVSHEMGHQFGANHTWTHGGSEGTGVQVEPGSGSTIMGYAGITGPVTDVQPNSDPYFHAKSIEQITDYIKTTACDVETATGNNAPTVDAGLDYVIPMGTPFVLTGTADDLDGDALTYCWEQIDENAASTTLPNVTAIDGVAFRSYEPISSPQRVFPNLDSVLVGLTDWTWEAVPEVDRELNFRLTVRDDAMGGGANGSDDIVIEVTDSAGPFQINSPNTNVTYAGGQTILVNWDVANTTDAPVNTSNVNILLSTDGGDSFDILLEAFTPNDGNALVVLPETPGTENRIKVESVGNIFFDITDEDFTIVENIDCDIEDENDFESGYGGWVDGGADCAIGIFPDFVFSGVRCLRLRDNSNSSTITSPSYDFAEAEEVEISFTYIANSFDNANEDFFLEMSLNNGPFNLIEEWNEGDEFENGQREFVFLTIPGPFTVNTKFRLRCDASANSDQVYIDDIKIENCFIVDAPTCNDGIKNGGEEGVDCGGPCGPCPCSDFDFNDFEESLGIWNDGGIDAARFGSANQATSGIWSVRLRDNTNTSIITTDEIDASSFGSAQISFNYYPVSFDTPDEDFWLQVSTDGGASFTTVEEWNFTDEFVNNEFYSDVVIIPGPLSANTQFRFRCDASSNFDRLYLDDILIEFCDENEMKNVFVMNTSYSTQVANYYLDFTDHTVVQGGVTTTDLSDKDLVFLPLPTTAFSPEAEADLADYLASGGRIVAIGCPCIGASIPIVNNLLANLGSSQSLNSTQIDGGGCSIETNLLNTDNSIVDGLTEIGIGCYTSVNSGSGNVLMTNSGLVDMISIESVGGGEIVLMNDIDYFYSCFIDETIIFAQGLFNPYTIPTGDAVDTEVGDFALTRSFETDIDLVSYPNPVVQGESLFLEIEYPQEGMSYEILDQTGRIISKAIWNSDYEMVELNTASFAAGQYLIKLNTESGTMTQKFMVLAN